MIVKGRLLMGETNRRGRREKSKADGGVEYY
jgi:hypothetical protein